MALDSAVDPEDVSQWFRVWLDETHVYRSARPPGREAWNDHFVWAEVIRVCLQVEPFPTSNGIYVYTRARPESYVIPVEAEGGVELLKQLIQRKLFDAALAIEAASATEGLFCWPPEE